jgi:hypothetical protein
MSKVNEHVWSHWSARAAAVSSSSNLGRSSISASADDGVGGWIRSRNGCDARGAALVMCGAGRYLGWGRVAYLANDPDRKDSARGTIVRKSSRTRSTAILLKVASLDRGP